LQENHNRNIIWIQFFQERRMSSPRTYDPTLSGEINLRKDHVDAEAGTRERRAKARICEPFPTTVTGTDKDGRGFQLEAEMGNISSSGLYLRMPRQLNIGDDMKFLIKFSNGISTGATASVLGRVLRVESGVDGLNGFGLAITHYEFV